MGWGKRAKFVPVNLTPQQGPQDEWALGMVHSIHADVMSVMQTERSKQRSIGISEIGTDCDKCLTRKLSGLYEPELPGSDSWKAQIGTFGHAGLEEHFGQLHPNVEHFTPTIYEPRYHLERRLQIRPWLGGSCDMYVEGGVVNGQPYGLVDDWKFQGARSLGDTGKGKIPSYYFVQMNTYGLGYELLGMPVSHLVLYALPRDDELNAARPVLMRYDRQVALDAIARCERFMAAAELVGWEALIDRQQSANDTGGHCWDCPRYEAIENRTFIDDLTG